MTRQINRAIVLAVALTMLAIPAFARDAEQQKRIDYLIESLGKLKGAVFIRNGSEYDASAAEAHLRQKLAYVGDKVKTAEQFIQYCASESSMSHRPYQIRFGDGTVTDTRAYFMAKLKEFDASSR